MTTVEQILKKPIVKKYIAGIKKLNKLDFKSFDHTHPLVVDLTYIAQKMSAIELVVLDWKCPELSNNSAYITALAGEDLMFDACYLMSVTGTAPNEATKHWGLNEKNVKEYQQQWLDIGVNPAEIQEEDWTTVDDEWKRRMNRGENS